MFFGRKKNSFSATDVFPLSDAIEDFDDSTSTQGVQPRRDPEGTLTAGRRKKGRKWQNVGAIAALYAVGLAGFWWLEVVDLTALLVLGGLVGLWGVVFLVLSRPGRYEAFWKKHSRLPIVASVMGSMLVMVYLYPTTQILMAPFTLLMLAYGVFTVPRKPLLAASAWMLAGYALVAALHYGVQDNLALLKLEALHWLALALAVPTFVLLLGKVQLLHRSLYQASRKIKNIQEDAQRDTLLGCFNRRYILAALEEQKQLADESGIPLCMAVLDIDHFKRINDDLGHLGGDEVLRTFARVAQQSVRAGDVFGRYGGEEFLLIFPGTSLLPALNTCERIRAQVESYAWEGLLKGRVTVSIGVTKYILGESVLEFFSRSDTAMYMAKEGGRNQVVVEEPVARGDQPASEIPDHGYF